MSDSFDFDDKKKWPTPAEAYGNKSSVVHASLQAPDNRDGLNTYSGRPPKVFYVIIGRGPAAVLNHTTLRQTDWGRKRIGALPLMQIGGVDPWLHYHGHAMGQPPYLLSFPGYKEQPAAGDVFGHTLRYKSKSFGANTQAEWSRLVEAFRKKGRFEWRNAWVGAIESPEADAKDLIKGLTDLGLTSVKDMQDKPTTLADHFNVAWPKGYTKETAPRYRLLLVYPTEKLQWVYARYVDICTGTGRMNVLKPAGAETDVYKKALTKYWLPPEKWEEVDAALKTRKVVHGMDGLREETVWNQSDRVCTYGGGGIGLNQVERAEDEDCWHDWTARNTVHDAFNLRTNDPVLKSYKPLEDDDGGHVKHFMETGEGDYRRENAWIENYGPEVEEFGFRKGTELLVEQPLYPGNSKWRITRKTTLEKAEEDSGKVKVTFLPNMDKLNIPPRIFDFDTESPMDVPGKGLPFSRKYKQRNPAISDNHLLYDRLILCNGQSQVVLGEPQSLTAHFTLITIPDADHSDMPLGLQTDDAPADRSRQGSIRVLGAAARIFPKFDEKAGQPKFELLKDYESTLPISAVLPGFIRAGRSIPAANSFFKEHGFESADGKKVNNNLNTASSDELKLFIKEAVPRLEAAQVDAVAQIILGGRMTPNNGYADTDALKQLLKAPDDLLAKLKKANQVKGEFAETTMRLLNEQDHAAICAKLEWKYPSAEFA